MPDDSQMSPRAIDVGAVRLIVSESDFLNTLIEALQAYGWLVAHFRPGMTSRIDSHGNPIWVTPVQADGKGFPDLVAVRLPPKRARILFIEAKSDKGKLSEAQLRWMDALGRCVYPDGPDSPRGPVEVYTMRPSNWAEIERILE